MKGTFVQVLDLSFFRTFCARIRMWGVQYTSTCNICMICIESKRLMGEGGGKKDREEQKKMRTDEKKETTKKK